MSTSRSNVVLGASVIAFAIAFNIPFSILASTFEYPDVLRRPAGEVLTLFNAGGASLILTWHAFALAALAFVPVSIFLALTQDRVTTRPALAIGAAVAGSLAGLAQAIGLWRWVFVVPGLARAYVDPASSDATRAAAENTFALINLYGGVAIGEHLGQLLTALFILLLSSVQMIEGHRIRGWIGFAAAAVIAFGTGEGLAIALGASGEVFGLATVGGFMLLSAWLVATGAGLVRGR